MASAPPVLPHLNFDPTEIARIQIAAAANRRAGASDAMQTELGYAQLAAQQQQNAARLAASELEKRLELDQKREETGQLMAYRQQQHQLEQTRYLGALRLRQEEQQREAQEAAQQMQAMIGIKRDIAAGVPPHEAFVRNSEAFVKTPSGLATAYKSFAPPPPVSTFGKTPEGVPFIQNPVTGQPIIIPASSMKAMMPDADLTTATKGRLQTSLQQGEKVVELGKDLLDKLVPGAVGLRGDINRLVINEGLAEFFPELKAGDVAEAQALIGLFNERVIEAIKSAGQVSNQDWIRYQKILPKPGFGESIASARDKINTALSELRQEKALDAKRLGLEQPLWTMSKEQIRSEYKAGRLTKQAAAAAIERYYSLEE